MNYVFRWEAARILTVVGSEVIDRRFCFDCQMSSTRFAGSWGKGANEASLRTVDLGNVIFSGR